jgi:hypothetical protein
MESKVPDCCCSAADAGEAALPVRGRSSRLPRQFALLAVALAAWWVVYRSLLPFSRWLTYDLFGLAPGRHLSAAVEFFLYDTPKVLLLLTLVVFGVGIVRSFFTPERTRRLLAGRRESAGNVLAALLGIVTPFCS